MTFAEMKELIAKAKPTNPTQTLLRDYKATARRLIRHIEALIDTQHTIDPQALGTTHHQLQKSPTALTTTFNLPES